MSASQELVWHDEWVRVLAELELDVEQAEAMLASKQPAPARVKPWIPPHVSPLPTSLAERARTLLDRQLRVSRELAGAARDSRRHDRALSKLRATDGAAPVYIDAPA